MLNVHRANDGQAYLGLRGFRSDLPGSAGSGFQVRAGTKTLPDDTRKVRQVSNPDAFYHYYFAQRVRDHEFDPNAWVTSLSQASPTRSLPAKLASDPIKVFEGNINSLDTVSMCLETFISAHGRRPKLEARVSYEAAKPGSKALKWLLDTGEWQRFDFVLHATFLRALAHCLVGEKQDRFLEQFIFLDRQSTSESASDEPYLKRNNYYWRGRTLLHFCQAQAFWTAKPLVLEDPVRSYLLISSAAMKAKVYIPTHVCGLWLIKTLRSSGPRARSESYEDFIHFLKVWSSDVGQRRFTEALLWLRHPEGPHVEPALAFLQDLEADAIQSATVEDLFRPARADLSQIVYFLFVLTAQTLKTHGRLPEAKWVLDLGLQRAPGLFAMGRIDEAYIDDTHVTRRRATKYELESGIADADGMMRGGRIRTQIDNLGYNDYIRKDQIR